MNICLLQNFEQIIHEEVCCLGLSIWQEVLGVSNLLYSTKRKVKELQKIANCIRLIL